MEATLKIPKRLDSSVESACGLAPAPRGRLMSSEEFWDLCGCLALLLQIVAMVVLLLFIGAVAAGAALIAMPFATVAYHARQWWLRWRAA